MKKMWLLGSASLLLCAGIAINNAPASSISTVNTANSAGNTSCADGSVPTCAQAHPLRQISETTTASSCNGCRRMSTASALPPLFGQHDRPIFNIEASVASTPEMMLAALLKDGPISAKALALLLSALAALCLLRRRDTEHETLTTQRRYWPTSLWSRKLMSQPTQDSV